MKVSSAFKLAEGKIIMADLELDDAQLETVISKAGVVTLEINGEERAFRCTGGAAAQVLLKTKQLSPNTALSFVELQDGQASGLQARFRDMLIKELDGFKTSGSPQVDFGSGMLIILSALRAKDGPSIAYQVSVLHTVLREIGEERGWGVARS